MQMADTGRTQSSTHETQDVLVATKLTAMQLSSGPRQPLLRRTLPDLIALTLYALLAILVTWPITPGLTRGIVGEVSGVDAYQDAWNLWWNAEALRQGQLPFFAPVLFYPYGVDLFWQTLGFPQGLVALPATLALGPLAAFNLTVLSSFVIGGYVTFLLARRVTQSAPAALVAGAVFVFSPYHIDKIIEGNLPLISIHWLPCYALALYLLLEKPSWWRALLSGFLLIWLSLGSWYYGMFSLLFTGCAVGIWAIGSGRAGWRRTLLWGMTPVLIWGGVLAPKLLGLARGEQALMDMQRLQIVRSADLIDFFLPNPRSPWWGPAVRAARAGIYPDAIIWNVALGWIGLLLAALGIVALWRQAWRWAVLLAATMILALGPVLRVAGDNTGVPLPFALVQNLPGIRAGQRPSHMAALSTLMLALLAAYGVVWLTRRVSARVAWPLAITLVLATSLLDGYAGPLTLVQRPIHPFYATLPQSTGALLPLPAYININRSENLTAQMAHHWPIVGGYVARPPNYPFAAYTPGIRELQDGIAHPDDIITPGWPEVGRDALADYAIRYITFDLSSQKDAYFDNVRALLRDLAVGPPLVADSQLEAYAVPDTWQQHPIMFLGAGWEPIERQPDTPIRWRWMNATAEIRLYNPYQQPVAASLALNASSFQEPRAVQLDLDGASFGHFMAQPDQPATQQFLFLLPPGEHTLTLAAPASPDPGRVGKQISVRVFRLMAAFGTPIK